MSPHGWRVLWMSCPLALLVAWTAGFVVGQAPEAAPAPRPVVGFFIQGDDPKAVDKDPKKQEKDKPVPLHTLKPEPFPSDGEVLPIDLPTALQLANASNPTIAMARERVQQAYWRQRQADFLWLPNLQAGGSYNRHDGLIQNARGDIFGVAKWNAFDGGGAAMKFQTADALFAPLVTRQLTRAQAAEARTVSDQVELDVAVTYLDLLEVHGRLAVNTETLTNALEMLKNAEAAQEAGLGKTPADAPRARTEVYQRRVERRELEAHAGQVSARLARLLLLKASVDLVPADPAVIPIMLVPVDGPLDDLILVGLQNRPELTQGQAQIEAAYARWRQAKWDPFLPRVEVGYLGGSFGGGRNSSTFDTGGRGDGYAQVYWELHNFGAGDVARAREKRAHYAEARHMLAEVQARVGAEVAVAAKDARARLRALKDAQQGVRQAMESWRRLKESAFGMAGPNRRYDPLEPLIAEQQLNAARLQYLAEVIGYNQAQFRLYAALGHPPSCALPEAAAVDIAVPVLPSTTEKK